MSKLIDLTGCKFERLTVIERADKSSFKGVQWVCRCDCGSMVVVRSGDLKTQKQKSCGCLRRETSAQNGKVLTIHGMQNTRLYREWSSMKNRCYNKNAVGYMDYGGRGIVVCEQWKNDFMAFYNWAMNSGYDETAPRGVCTLERKDNNGNYSPENCKWATNREQQNNKRNNRLLTYNGETKTAAQWAEEIGINLNTIHSRMWLGWSDERILTEPLHEEKRRV